MPDKEFDNLFRDKFKDAEITPSANLWANIEKELEPSKKRSMPIYWMAAAGIAIALSAMLVFQKKEVIQLHGTDQTAKVQAVDPVEPEQVPVTNAAAVEPGQKMQVKKQEIILASTTSQEKLPVNQVVENNLQNNQLALQPNANDNHLPIKKQDPKPIDVLPVKETPIDNQVVIANTATTKNEIPYNTIAEEGSTDRKGIRNVGDLVNYVVEKVDKRDKKLVRFNTDDDDNSSIIGINIGFLKLNKKNKDK